MIIPSKCKVERIIPKDDEGRERLPYAIHRKGYLEATNGVSLVRLKTGISKENPETIIPRAALELARLAVGRRQEDLPIELVGGVVKVKGARWLREAGTWPDSEKVFKKLHRELRQNAISRATTLSINPYQLLDLAKALGWQSSRPEGLVLRFVRGSDGNVDTGILVELASNPDGVGILMPCKV